MAEISLTRGLVAIVSDSDYDWLSRFKWTAYMPGKKPYAARNEYPVRRCVYMHRLILGAKQGQVVDHINGDTLDNRRPNLRICDWRGNARNSEKRGTARYKGITWNGYSWVAQIHADGKCHYLGSFRTDEAAARAYDAEAARLWGHFARLNFRKDVNRAQRTKA